MEELTETQSFAKLKLEEFVGLRVDQQIARICVWGVHHERVEQSRMLAELRSCTLSEEEVYEVAFFFRKVWQIDAPRNTRSECFLCFADLPTHEERLCQCFREAEVAVWIEPTPQSVAWLKKQYPRDWQGHIMEVINCQMCKRNASIRAGLVASKFKRGSSVWNSPQFCQPCFVKKQKQRDPSTPQRKPGLHVPVKARVESATLEDLHAQVAQVSPPLAES